MQVNIYTKMARAGVQMEKRQEIHKPGLIIPSQSLSDRSISTTFTWIFYNSQVLYPSPCWKIPQFRCFSRCSLHSSDHHCAFYQRHCVWMAWGFCSVWCGENYNKKINVRYEEEGELLDPNCLLSNAQTKVERLIKTPVIGWGMQTAK